MASSIPPPREGPGPHGVVYAEEVDVPNALERLWSTLFGDSEAFRLKRRALLMRALQMLFGLLAVVLSTCYDLPRAVPVRVKRDGFVLIDAGVISSMFAFPAYVYLTTIAIITFVGSMLFALLLLMDLSLVGGSSEHESVRYKIDNNAPYLALCFDFIFLILATTSACASFGLTNVMHMSLDYGAMSFAPNIERVFETIFDFKVGAGVVAWRARGKNTDQNARTRALLSTSSTYQYVASACMFAQSIFIGATLMLTYQHIEERQTQMTLLGIPPTATQQSIDFIFRFYKTFSSGVGRRSEDRAAISPLFVNRVVQVLLSLACFVVCYDIIDWTEQELKFVFVPAFHIITWVSLALFIIRSVTLHIQYQDRKVGC